MTRRAKVLAGIGLLLAGLISYGVVFGVLWPSQKADAAEAECRALAGGGAIEIEWRIVPPSWSCSWSDDQGTSGGSAVIQWFEL